MTETRYMISDVSRILDIPSNVLRYLEYHLSLSIKRTELGHRYYLQEDIDLIRSVKELRDKGFHLKIIRSILPYIDKIVQLEPERLNEMRDRMEAALGLSGSEAQERIKAQYGKTIDINMEEGDFVFKDPSTKQMTRVGIMKKTTEGVNIQATTQGVDKPGESLYEDEVAVSKVGDYKKSKADRMVGTEKTIIPVVDLEKEIRKDIRTKGNSESGTNREESHKSEEIQAQPQGKQMLDHKSEASLLRDSQDKIVQFKEIMCAIVMDALQQNNRALTNDINETVTQSIVKEMDYMLKIKEEHEEERFRQLDRAIREAQQQRQQAAITKEGKKKKPSKFFQKNKVRI